LKYLLIAIFCFSLSSFAQQKPDTTAIAFKAKLLSLSECGLSSKQELLRILERQKVSFLKSDFKNFLFLKLRYSQDYQGSKRVVSLNGNPCYVYLAFNISELRFYRLTGFRDPEVDDFFKDMINSGNSETDFNSGVETLDMAFLYSYYKLDIEKRRAIPTNPCDLCGLLTITH